MSAEFAVDHGDAVPRGRRRDERVVPPAPTGSGSSRSSPATTPGPGARRQASSSILGRLDDVLREAYGSRPPRHAARALGGSDVQILRRHVLPNIGGTVATSVLGQALLLEATIEFFSYGLPASCWRSLGQSPGGHDDLRGPRTVRIPAAGWWNWAFPAIVLTLVLSSVNVVGDALDEAFSPLR